MPLAMNIINKIERNKMQSRRSFIFKSIIAAAAVLLPSFLRGKLIAGTPKDAKKLSCAAVLWYSQAGHTERVGRLIARRWEKEGLKVTASDIRDFKRETLGSYDIIAIGNPVFYFEVPKNVREWLSAMPDITGIPVASFVTYGGPGNNQHNTACGILQLASEKGGVPAGLGKFGNMSTFAPTWSTGNSGRILEYRQLPNKETYDNVRAYAKEVLENVRQGRNFEIQTEVTMYNMLKYFGSAWVTKMMIADHRILSDKCIGCGKCVDKCPVGAIDLAAYKVDTGKCIACMGCVNNCPVQAVNMKFLGSNVYGFNKFLQDNKIVIVEPVELGGKA